jgi:hypothetical protein
MVSCSNSKDISKNEVSWILELKKSGCLDVCKSYTISIKENGQFDYRGYYNVNHIGKKSSELKADDLDTLTALLKTMNWNEFDDFYGEKAGDAPRKELNFTSKSDSKKIIYHRLEPQEIRKLELLIDTIIDHDEF